MNVINKYNNSMIYTIRSPATDKYYIGSTTQILCKRFSDHNRHYKKYLDEKHHFVTSFKIIELGDSYIELLEEVNCENKNQLEKREGDAIRKHKANCVNKRIEGRTKKQHYNDNKDKIAEYKKQNYIDNKESISKRSKQYGIDNKESISKHKKQYYNDNIESINAKKKLQYLCTCGSTIQLCTKAQHNKTAKHLKALEQEIIII